MNSILYLSLVCFLSLHHTLYACSRHVYNVTCSDVAWQASAETGRLADMLTAVDHRLPVWCNVDAFLRSYHINICPTQMFTDQSLWASERVQLYRTVSLTRNEHPHSQREDGRLTSQTDTVDCRTKGVP